jgi:uncharacterized protein YkwD
MQTRMTLKLTNRSLIVPLLAILAAAIAALLFAPPMSGSASASACKRWGNDKPAHLRHGQARKALLCLVNRKRHQHNRGSLHRNKRLQKAAQKHTEYMESHHCFDHQCSGEKSPLGRLESTGYISGRLSRWAYGENIGWGLKRRGSPHQIVHAWMNSSEHRANILSGTFDDAGVGFVEGTPSNPHAHGGMYTMDFGMRQG